MINSETYNVILKLNPSKSPVMIRGLNQKKEEDKNLSYVIMPIIKG